MVRDAPQARISVVRPQAREAALEPEQDLRVQLGLAAATQDIWNSWPEPSSGRRSADRPGVGHDRARLLHAQDGRREVVGRVVQHRAAADVLELRPQGRASSIIREPTSR